MVLINYNSNHMLYQYSLFTMKWKISEMNLNIQNCVYFTLWHSSYLNIFPRTAPSRGGSLKSYQDLYRCMALCNQSPQGLWTKRRLRLCTIVVLTEVFVLGGNSVKLYALHMFLNLLLNRVIPEDRKSKFF